MSRASREGKEGAAKEFRSAGDILAMQDLKTEELYIDEWATWVRVRTMAGIERDAWELRIQAQRREGRYENLRAGLVAMAVVDEHGVRLFSDEQVTALGRKSARALDRIFEVASRLNRLTEKDVEEIEGNSGAGRSAAPGSGSV